MREIIELHVSETLVCVSNWMRLNDYRKFHLYGESKFNTNWLKPNEYVIMQLDSVKKFFVIIWKLDIIQRLIITVI